MSELENVIKSAMERPSWLEQKLAESDSQNTREDELLEKIIELEDRDLVLEKQASYAMRLAEYWRERAGSSNETDPFPWEESIHGQA